ncbi:hypothetical protein [Psittacicella gerlachiana]|uniref:Chorismate lyase n=1 Tax=Psittacicella gerlachiana TaxID=2028574 RepID=A0A3A1Y907_9GAMM|nr:hypothetical protein [Psittacicella gerlachiana]RIY33806.1 hypothetical protein CKF59_06130 [Psittacicella gerlachiana]
MQNLISLIENLESEPKLQEFTNCFSYLNSLQQLDKAQIALFEKISKAHGINYEQSITKLIEQVDNCLPKVEVKFQEIYNHHLLRFVLLKNKHNSIILEGYTFLDLSQDLQLSQTLTSLLYEKIQVPLGIWLFQQDFTASDFQYFVINDHQILRLRSFLINCRQYVHKDIFTTLHLVEIFNLSNFSPYLEQK